MWVITLQRAARQAVYTLVCTHGPYFAVANYMKIPQHIHSFLGRSQRGLFLTSLSPWAVALCILALALLVLALGVRTAQYEADLTQRLMSEKGASLIGTLEGALRTGMGFQWTDAEIQDLLEKTADQPDIVYVIIADASGQVLAASHSTQSEAAGLTEAELATLNPGVHSQAQRVARAGEQETFQVYRMLEVPRFDERMKHYAKGGHGRGGGRRQQVTEAARKYTGQPLYVFVAYTTTALREAEAADRRHLYAMSAIVVFLLLVGMLVAVLIHNHRQSRLHMQEQLRHSERLAALGSMAAGIAHEVRNPLGAIKGLARFFQEISPAHSEAQRMAGIMNTEVRRLDKVVCDMLDFAKQDHLRPQAVALDSLVQRVSRLIQPDIQAHNVTFIAHVPQPAPLLYMDADRMTQVLLNLCCNSLQALQQSTPAAGLLELRYTEETDALVLEVRDNGPGMSEETRTQAFSPYFTTRAEGTGLGLCIVHKIVAAHGASITLNSAVGTGTSVYIRLPRRCLLTKTISP